MVMIFYYSNGVLSVLELKGTKFLLSFLQNFCCTSSNIYKAAASIRNGYKQFYEEKKFIKKNFDKVHRIVAHPLIMGPPRSPPRTKN